MFPKVGGALLNPNTHEASIQVRKQHVNVFNSNNKKMCYNKHHLLNTSYSKAMYIWKNTCERHKGSSERLFSSTDLRAALRYFGHQNYLGRVESCIMQILDLVAWFCILSLLLVVWPGTCDLALVNLTASVGKNKRMRLRGDGKERRGEIKLGISLMVL